MSKSVKARRRFQLCRGKRERKNESSKATNYLCACVPLVLCAFQIEFDLELNEKQTQ